MRSQALRADFLMLITAMIWGTAFVAQRVGMDNIGPFLFTGLRFTLATTLRDVHDSADGQLSLGGVFDTTRLDWSHSR